MFLICFFNHCAYSAFISFFNLQAHFSAISTLCYKAESRGHERLDVGENAHALFQKSKTEQVVLVVRKKAIKEAN